MIVVPSFSPPLNSTLCVSAEEEEEGSGASGDDGGGVSEEMVTSTTCPVMSSTEEESAKEQTPEAEEKPVGEKDFDIMQPLAKIPLRKGRPLIKDTLQSTSFP